MADSGGTHLAAGPDETAQRALCGEVVRWDSRAVTHAGAAPVRRLEDDDARRVTLVVVIDLPDGGVDAFRRYEDAVLPLLPRHGGRLERRLRSADGRSEVHVVSFASDAGCASYLADPRRQAHRALLDGVEVVQRLLQVEDVPLPER